MCEIFEVSSCIHDNSGLTSPDMAVRRDGNCLYIYLDYNYNVFY